MYVSNVLNAVNSCSYGALFTQVDRDKRKAQISFKNFLILVYLLEKDSLRFGCYIPKFSAS